MDAPARPLMLRLFILLLFVMTAFQLAAPSMQALVGHAAVTSLVKASAAGATTARDKTDAPCDARAPASSASAGCNAPPACATCNICQVCHQAAMVETSSPAMLTALTWTAFPPTSAGNASVEHAPSFKPPIV